jgi:hypothetical protein
MSSVKHQLRFVARRVDNIPGVCGELHASMQLGSGGHLQAELLAKRKDAKAWAAAISLAISAGVIYVSLRPPLYDFDGYLNRLRGFSPFRAGNFNQHHLLWYPLEILLVKCLSVFGWPSPAAFQSFGIAVNCFTLLFLYRLIWQASKSALLTVILTIFAAFSPQFWFMGFENHLYSVVYLFTVLYLESLCKGEDQVPERLRLVAAGLCLLCAVLFHQAIVLLIPAGALTLLICGRERLRDRLRRSLIWAGSILTAASAAYLTVARLSGVRNLSELLDWLTEYMHEEHPVRILLPESISKSVMGITRSIAQTYKLEDFLLNRVSGKTIYWLYAGLALAGFLGAALALRKRVTRSRLRELFLKNPLFNVSVLSIFAWGAFAFAWEPAGHYWVPNLFPALVCLGLLLRGAARKKIVLLTAPLVLLSGWNVYANHVCDQTQSINFPEPWLDAIHKELGGKDIFIVLAREWFANMDYDLLLGCLDALPRNPGVAVLNEFVLNPETRKSWPQQLRARIDSTLRTGGRVFIANHLLSPDSYTDLPCQESPFSEYTREEYLKIDVPKLRQQLEAVLRSYKLVSSPLKIGFDLYWELRR